MQVDGPWTLKESKDESIRIDNMWVAHSPFLDSH